MKTLAACKVLRFPAETHYLCEHLHCSSSHQGLVHCKEWWVNASQLDLPSLTPLAVAGSCRLQLGVAQ